MARIYKALLKDLENFNRKTMNPKGDFDRLEDYPDPFDQPDTVSMWRFVWPALLTLLIFVLSFLAMMYLPEFNAWMDRIFDKSDQQKTGIIILAIGSVSYAAMFFYGVITKR